MGDSTCTHLDFRAPPPSPVGSTRRSSFTANDDVLSDFLYKSTRVPNLVLPDRVFPKHRLLLNPPTFDFLHLVASDLMDAIASVGCFQLINHGVSEGMLRSTVDKTIFVETEELVWYNNDAEVEGIDSPTSYYSEFREWMEELRYEVERIGKVVRERLGGGGGGIGVCYVRKHKSIEEKGWEEEAIRMLIRGYDERHSLSLHFCQGASEFHVYSKKAWVSFTPRPNALLVTVGDAGWNGRFKAVVGRPLYRSARPRPRPRPRDVPLQSQSHESPLSHDFISLSFLYTLHTTAPITPRNNTLSLTLQLLFTLFLTLLLLFFFP